MGTVQVSLIDTATNGGAAATACSAGGDTVVSIRFVTDHGDLPNLRVDVASLSGALQRLRRLRRPREPAPSRTTPLTPHRTATAVGTTQGARRLSTATGAHTQPTRSQSTLWRGPQCQRSVVATPSSSGNPSHHPPPHPPRSAPTAASATPRLGRAAASPASAPATEPTVRAPSPTAVPSSRWSGRTRATWSSSSTASAPPPRSSPPPSRRRVCGEPPSHRPDPSPWWQGAARYSAMWCWLLVSWWHHSPSPSPPPRSSSPPSPTPTRAPAPVL